MLSKTKELQNRVTEKECVNNFNVNLANERIALVDKLNKRLGQLNRLHRVAATINAATSLKECLATVVDQLSQVVASDYTSVMLFADDGTPTAVVENREMMVPLVERCKEGNPVHTIVTTGKPIYFANLANVLG